MLSAARRQRAYLPSCLGATDAGDVSNFRIGIRYAIRYFALVSEHRCCCAQARFMPNLQSLLAQDKSEVMGTRVALVRPKVDYSLNCVPLWIGQGQRRLLRVRRGSEKCQLRSWKDQVLLARIIRSLALSCANFCATGEGFSFRWRHHQFLLYMRIHMTDYQKAASSVHGSVCPCKHPCAYACVHPSVRQFIRSSVSSVHLFIH